MDIKEAPAGWVADRDEEESSVKPGMLAPGLGSSDGSQVPAPPHC